MVTRNTVLGFNKNFSGISGMIVGNYCITFLERNFAPSSCSEILRDNDFHNVLRLFDVLPNFLFTTSETMGDYYLQRWYIRVASLVVKQLKT